MADEEVDTRLTLQERHRAKAWHARRGGKRLGAGDREREGGAVAVVLDW
jgi:hypothetical protein